jgi:hypothetical protein
MKDPRDAITSYAIKNINKYMKRIALNFELERVPTTNFARHSFLCMQRHETLYQVRIAVKEVFGVGSMHTSFSITHQQFIL